MIPKEQSASTNYEAMREHCNSDIIYDGSFSDATHHRASKDHSSAAAIIKNRYDIRTNSIENNEESKHCVETTDPIQLHNRNGEQIRTIYT